MVLGLILRAVSLGLYKNIFRLDGFILGVVAICVGALFKLISLRLLF